ncbi:P-type conjugative transfer protein TrbG [Erwinia amylovora]|uniref:P-type conjugative transfer protein TrbG n=1 Tax=Erwinia amylovora TaxID=552 RepID=UPI0014442E03|nr:P-type conjugative transfer protein TrbG [Erwinia amylovora]
MKKHLIALAFASVPALVSAQQVPALNNATQQQGQAAQNGGNPFSGGNSSAQAAPQSPPPPINVLSGRQSALDAKERKAVSLSQQWISRRDMPTRGMNGAVVFNYGSTLPTVVCAPLRTCLLTLQPGEYIVKKGLNAGDTVRWQITPTVFGDGDNKTTALNIKPTDSGLTTNLSILTNRRMYQVNLVSRIKDWMPNVSFAYPDDVNKAWDDYYAANASYKRDTRLPGTGQDVTNLDFGYRISGDKPAWRPLRVYSSGYKTYIQFPSSIRGGDMPVLQAIGGDDEKQLVNYRPIRNDLFEVDKLITKAVLISGVGSNQIEVEIERDKGAN